MLLYQSTSSQLRKYEGTFARGRTNTLMFRELVDFQSNQGQAK